MNNEEMPFPQDASALFAETIASTRFEQLSEAVVEAAKKSTLDTLAVMLGALGEAPALDAAARLAVGIGGKAEASLFGRSDKVPAMMAAFANGALVHYLDYDDIEFDSVYHPSGAIIPALVAIAERKGDVSGREFLTAVALGQDMGIRMARAIPLQRRPPWHRTVVIGTFAAAAASARLIGLDKDGIHSAIGHALNQAAGSLELRWGAEAEIGGMYVGYSAKAGIFAAMMAEAGIAGTRNAFDGEAGFFNLYFEGNCNRDKLLAGLGRVFTNEQCALKPWPACAATNTYVLATLNAIKEAGISHDDIAAIELLVGDYARKNCEPLEVRQRPSSGPDAKFSLPYSVAAAAVRGDLRIGEFSKESLSEPTILGLASRVSHVIDPTYDIQGSIPPGAVRLILHDGRVLTRHEELPFGHPDCPLSWEQLASKARDCLCHGRSDLDAASAEQLVRLCRRLDGLPDLGPLYALLAGRP